MSVKKAAIDPSNRSAHPAVYLESTNRDGEDTAPA